MYDPEPPDGDAVNVNDCVASGVPLDDTVTDGGAVSPGLFSHGF